MAKFYCKEDVSASSVVFESYIDGDGDFVVKANGQLLFYISSDSGEMRMLYKSPHEQVWGLEFVDGYIKVETIS